MSTLFVSFFAGTLSVLSPCVLPVLPIIVASALQRHRHGPLALAGGLVVSSTALGLFFASFGFAIDVDRDVARAAGGAVMAVIGVTLFVPRLEELFGRFVAPFARGAGALTGRLPSGLPGQLILGMLLGVVWTPCTGPTLAAAVTLASGRESFAGAGMVMFTFGIGAVVPVLLFAYASRRTVTARGMDLSRVAAIGKPVMGIALVAIGALTLTGTDKIVETWMVDHMPEWMLALTTRF